MNWTLDSNTPALLALSQTMYLPPLSMISLTFEALLLPVAVTGRPDFAASLIDSMPVLNFLLHLRAVS